ncbi:MFS transporter [Shouchella shacheensis]|uniref:MFS transporter n=1 Tax=Shouchella shacheensis TaxID=1649580 RepID=UPI00073FF3A9|nr:MFS transporter [Shouchella shacheensis]
MHEYKKLVAICVLPTMIVIGNAMFVPIMPSIQHSLALTEGQAAWFLSVFTFSGICAIPLGQLVARRRGMRKASLLGTLFVVVGSLGAGLTRFFDADSVYLWFLSMRIVQGIGAGSLAALAMTLVPEQFQKEDQQVVFGQVELANALAKALSPLIGGLLLYLSWTYSFVVFLAVSLMAFVFVLLYLPSEPPSRERKKSIRKKEKMRKAQLMVCLPAFVLSAAVLFVLYGLLFYASYSFEMQAFSPASKGILLALPLSVMALVSARSHKIVERVRISYSQMLVLSSALLAGATALLFLEGGNVLLMFILALCAVSTGMAMPTSSTFISQKADASVRNAALSFLSIVRFAGIALAPVVYEQWMNHAHGLLSAGSLAIAVLALLTTWVVPVRRVKHS